MISLEEWCKTHNRLDILERWSIKNIIRPTDISFGCTTKVFWECEKGHIWEATPNKITQKTSSGCPYCANQKVWKGYNDLQSNKPEIAREWHPTKNLGISPEEVTAFSNKEVWWLCPKGHEYKCKINQRTRESRKGGCPVCAHKKLLPGFNDLQTICPEVAAEWHPTKNGDLKPQDVLPSTQKRIWWICPKGHEYLMPLNSRVCNNKMKSGCPICTSKSVLAGYNDLQSQFPQIAAEWHPTKNGCVTPSMVVSGAHTKYWWLCPLGHEYTASPENRTKINGTGCPICANEKQSSFAEQATFYYLKQVFPNAINRANVQGKEIDIFLPTVRIGIEYDGRRYHTKDKRQKEEQKDAFLKTQGIKIIRIKEYRYEAETEKYSDTIWLCTKSNQYRELEKAINSLISKLPCAVPKVDIDIRRDSIAIMNQYVSSIKEGSLAALFPDLAREWCQEMNKTVLPNQVSSGSGKIFWWQCSAGHRYQMSVVARTSNKSGCPYCAGQKVLPGFNDLETRYPDIASEWHPEKNAGIKASEIMPGSQKKIWWLCPKGHEYSSSVASRTNRNSGCPYCSGLKAINGETDLKSIYPVVAKEWCYEKNEPLRPEDVKPFSHSIVWWICPKGHLYRKAIADRIGNYKNNKKGCPYCSGTKILSGSNDLATRFPEIADYWHPKLNGELKPTEIGPYSTKIVWWLKEDGSAKQQRIDTFVSTWIAKQKKK